jgi:antitoxin VapB
METAKLFLDGKSQAVQLTKQYRFQGDRVYIKKLGEAVNLLPVRNP